MDERQVVEGNEPGNPECEGGGLTRRANDQVDRGDRDEPGDDARQPPAEWAVPEDDIEPAINTLPSGGCSTFGSSPAVPSS